MGFLSPTPDNDPHGLSKIDLKKDGHKLTEAQKHYMEKARRIQEANALRTRAQRSSARKWAFGLTTLSLSIYFYTMYHMKSERFEDFDEMPENTKKA